MMGLLGFGVAVEEEYGVCGPPDDRNEDMSAGETKDKDKKGAELIRRTDLR